MSRDDPFDELLAALDQFTNAVHWLRARTDYTAVDGLREALAEWTVDRHKSTEDTHADLGDTMSAFLTADDVPAVHALADALNAWSAAVSAEHHHSNPFQGPLVGDVSRHRQ